jgi:hypothetical protein
VVEVLATLLRKAANVGMIKGVMSHLILEGITHIQDADDTILMVDGEDSSIVNMKLILYCFEWMLGLKINYHKSEAYIFRMEQDDKRRIANMLNCQLGELPIKYLGIPLDPTKLGREALAFLPGKISKRIPPWKGKQMSSGGRLILTNRCLTSLSTYMMGFYLLPQGTHRQMDSISSKFFWRGAGIEFKYHMVKWQAVCRPKEFGGLGIINTMLFNECLITKWIWKIYKQKDNLWVRLLTAKYMPRGDFFRSNSRHGSQFWKSLHKVKHLFK